MDMDLKSQLKAKKSAIVKKWFDAVAETYPENTSGFLKKQKAQFTNPVGYTLSEGLEGLFEALLKGMIREPCQDLSRQHHPDPRDPGLHALGGRLVHLPAQEDRAAGTRERGPAAAADERGTDRL